VLWRAVPCCGVLWCAVPDYVPPLGKGALYLRPLLMGSGPILGLGPAPSYTFAIYAAAVGSYFKVCVVFVWGVRAAIQTG
jgi:branched-subunit amino acid aminotransferase/4-amino-4-deoxychorismate lyase